MMENNQLDQKDNKEEHKKMWIKARWGVIIIIAIQIFVTIIMLASTTDPKNGKPDDIQGRLALLPIMFNYFISYLYISNKIEKGKAEENLMMMGVKVAGVIFLIQLILGILLITFAVKNPPIN